MRLEGKRKARAAKNIEEFIEGNYLQMKSNYLLFVKIKINYSF